MKTITNITKKFYAPILLISVLGIASCSKDSDSTPAANSDGSVAATCVNSTSGTGTFKVSGNAAANVLAVGICSGSEYSAVISGTTGTIALQFKGMPNAGTFSIKNPAEFFSSPTKNVVFVAAADKNSSTRDYVSGNLSQVVTVEKAGNTIRIKLPSITVNIAGTTTGILVEADMSLTF